MDKDTPECESCGCGGNEECGAEPINKEHDCALDARLICYCCREIGKSENIKRWNK
jgi:hypothetical protein